MVGGWLMGGWLRVSGWGWLAGHRSRCQLHCAVSTPPAGYWLHSMRHPNPTRFPAPPLHHTCNRTFYRVWAFLILEFHFMAVMLWGWQATKSGSYYTLCSVALDHAFLSLLDQVAGAWTQRAISESC